MEELAIARVQIGERRREDMGNLEELAESIEKYGLLHPIVIDEDAHLVSGGRRLAACAMLGWSMVPVRNLGDLTEAERREIELEENLRRKDLTAYERSKFITERVRLAVESGTVELERAESLAPMPPTWPTESRSESEQVSRGSRGPSRQAGSYRDVQSRTGIAPSVAVEAAQHVEAAEAYPFMQSPDWSQNAALTARKHLEALPAPVRETVADMVSEPGVPARDALSILANVREMPPEKQEEIVTLHRSPDHRERDRAMTTAAAKPPMPDPQIIAIGNAVRELQMCVRKYPDDTWTERLRWLIEQLGEVQDAIREHGRKQA